MYVRLRYVDADETAHEPQRPEPKRQELKRPEPALLRLPAPPPPLHRGGTVAAAGAEDCDVLAQMSFSCIEAWRAVTWMRDRSDTQGPG